MSVDERFFFSIHNTHRSPKILVTHSLSKDHNGVLTGFCSWGFLKVTLKGESLMTECCFIKIIKNYQGNFHLWFTTLKSEEEGADPLRCGQLPVLCRRNVLSKQRQTHDKRKPLTCVWQNVLTRLCGTFINVPHSVNCIFTDALHSE